VATVAGHYFSTCVLHSLLLNELIVKRSYCFVSVIKANVHIIYYNNLEFETMIMWMEMCITVMKACDRVLKE